MTVPAAWIRRPRVAVVLPLYTFARKTRKPERHRSNAVNTLSAHFISRFLQLDEETPIFHPLRRSDFVHSLNALVLQQNKHEDSYGGKKGGNLCDFRERTQRLMLFTVRRAVVSNLIHHKHQREPQDQRRSNEDMRTQRLLCGGLEGRIRIRGIHPGCYNWARWIWKKTIFILKWVPA